MGWIRFLCLFEVLLHSYATDQKDQGISQEHEEGDLLKQEFSYAKFLDTDGLKQLKESSSVGTVYFYKKRLPHMNVFFTEYDKSAGFLGAYGITLGLVDCTGEMDGHDACMTADGEKIYTYRLGTELLDLDLDTMFDVNSIMSNILQLALLNEVTIIQTKQNRQLIERESAGHTDIIYGYHTAIGTYEHRVFMEIAYAYHDKYRFILTTEPASISGLQDSAAVVSDTTCSMWVLYCREKYDAANGCRSVNYRGEFNLLALANFLRALSLPKVFYFPKDGTVIPCEQEETLGCVYIVYHPAAQLEAKKVIDSIQFDVHGLAGLVVTEINPEDVTTLDSSQKPQLSVSRPGQKEERKVMDKDWEWTLENVEYFITTNLFQFQPDSPVDQSPDSAAETEEADTDSVDSIDDMVVHVAYQQREKTAEVQYVPALTDETFPSVTTNSRLAVVLFYLPFDARSMVFLLQYQRAGQALAGLKGDDPNAHPLARVNCFDWTDVCQKANISTYPQIHIYRNGQRDQYMRALDKDVLVQTVSLLEVEQPLTLKTAEEVDSFVGGLLPIGADKMTDNFVLLKPSKTKEEITAFKQVVKSLETQMLFAVVSPDVEIPPLRETGVLHIRLSDPYRPTDKLTADLSSDSIKEFLLKGQFHLLPELTHVNFPKLYARQKPFSILFTGGSEADAQTTERVIVSIIKAQHFPELIFCKMSMDRKNLLAESLLSKYTDWISVPTFVIINHRQGTVHVMQDGEFSQVVLMTWIHGVLHGTVAPTKLLEKGEWKPVGSYYDFLKMIDEERKDASSQKPSARSECPLGNCEQFSEMLEPGSARLTEMEEADSDTRANLLELQNSRLYSGKDRRSHHHHALPTPSGPAPPPPSPPPPSAAAAADNVAPEEAGDKDQPPYREEL